MSNSWDKKKKKIGCGKKIKSVQTCSANAAIEHKYVQFYLHAYSIVIG